MAEKSIADSRHHLPIDTPQPILKDMHGSENTLPLSPEWLQPKSGDNKMGIEYHASPQHAEHTSLKGPGNGDDLHEVKKNKNIYRLALHDSETGSRDRWRDEERETNSALRRDHRAERWPDNSTRQSGRESSFDQRRESKWNPRWGPDDRESESSRNNEVAQEKLTPRLSNHGRDADKEGETHFRSWRSNSSMNRGKVEPSYQHPLTPHKQNHLPGYGRGKGENVAQLSPSGRGNFPFNHTSTVTSRPYHLGSLSNKIGVHSVSSPLRYGRMKLLEIYRVTDLRNHRESVEGIIDAPSLIRSEPLEPLALTSPTIEELVIMNAIEKGEVANSGVPSKEGNAGRNIVDSVMSKQMKLGIHEDLPHVGDDYRIEGSASTQMYDGRNPESEPANHMIETYSKKTGKTSEEVNIPETQFSHNPAPWRSQSKDIIRMPSTDSKECPLFGAKSSEVSWSHLREVAEIESSSAYGSSSLCKDGSSWQNNQFCYVEDKSNPKIRRYASDVSDREQSANPFLDQEESLLPRVNLSTRNFEPNPSPDELSLCYRDPHGHIQGPFSGSDLISWFEAGYFGIDLEVRPANAPPNAPFLLLGDVIPQLRLKFRPPPGFFAANSSEIQGMSDRDKNGSTVVGTYSSIGYGPSKSMQKSGNVVSTEAVNRVSESFLSTNLGSPSEIPSEGLLSCGVNGPGYSPSLLGDVGNSLNYLLAQKRLLEEQHNSLPNTLPFLSGRDSFPMATSMGIVPNSSDSQSKFIPLGIDPTCQASHTSQKLDLLSLLQAGQADRLPSVGISSGAVALPTHSDAHVLNNSGRAGLEIPENKMDVHQNYNLGSQIGLVVQQQQQQQQQLLQQHNLPSLSHLVNFPSNLSGMVSPEQFHSSDITQDKVFNMLAQHYLLSQPPLQSPISVPSQFSLLNECLLLKQQLQQQQQQLLQQQQQQLLQQQQQLFLSQVLSGHQSSQHLGEPSQKLHSVGKDVPTDHLLQRQGQDAYINQKIPSDNLPNEHNSTIQTVNLQDSKNRDSTSSSSGSSLLHLPHQISSSSSKKSESYQDAEDNYGPEFSLASRIVGTPPSSDALEKSIESANDLNLKFHAEETGSLMPQPGENVRSECPVLSQEVSSTSGFVVPIADQIHDMKISSEDNTSGQHFADGSAAKDSKNLETCQTKKTTERKVRKKKNSKSQLALELLKGFSITNQPGQPTSKFESEDVNPHVLPEAQIEMLSPHDFVSADVDGSCSTSYRTGDSQRFHLPPGTNTDNEVKSSNIKAGCIDSGISELPSLRAWKAAPGIRAKSLKEIQQEEQQRAQMEKAASEIVISPTCSVSVPWAGTVSGFDKKSTGRDILQVDSSTEYILHSESNMISKSRKSHLHDLLAEEVLAHSGEPDANISRNSQGQHLPPILSSMTIVDVSTNDEEFVEAKDTKKSRKKASKAKSSGTTNPSTVGFFDLSSSPVASEKRENQNQVQNENEVLPISRAAPSLADFVSWKEEPLDFSQLSAWTADMGKLHKPTSLRDIQKEQENRISPQRNTPSPIPAKVQANQGNRGSGSWQVPRLSPSIDTPNSRKLKTKIEDDLFWGPVDQSKQQVEQHGFPALGNSNWGAKSPARVNPIPINWQKSHSPSASSLSASRAKKDDEPSNLSEAMGFRDWCEKELVRLTGTNDTSFLEYCLKQPAAETEILLKENLGSLDRNHEFIDKFLSYKDLLSSKVIEMAFRANSSRPASGTGDAGSTAAAAVDSSDANAEASKGGKKKGKKGKKMSPAVLGFNVASNRIMMGDIQAVDE